MRLKFCFVVLVGVSLFSGLAHGQWRTQDLTLKRGWNAVYLHVDTADETLDRLIATDGANPIDEIWLWVPEGPGMQFLRDPLVPSATGSRWLRWHRHRPELNTMDRLPGNVAALVRVAVDHPTATFTWSIKGRPMSPAPTWSATGLNLIGFPTRHPQPPNWAEFIAGAGEIPFEPEIYRYVGGPLDSSNPVRVVLPRAAPVTRGEAFWVRTEEFNRYFGPFTVSLQNRHGIRFGERLERFRLRLSNPTSEPVTVTATLLASEVPPAGYPEIAALPPLIARGELNIEQLIYGFTRFSAGPQSWTLAPAGQDGSEIDVVLGLDRTLMTGDSGAHHAGILRLTDNKGILSIEVGVSAETAATTGLWLGNAALTEVRHYLVAFQQGVGGELAQDESGSYVPASIDTSFGSVARPYPIRLILHQSEEETRLLQRVFVGMQTAENLVLTLDEAVLHPQMLASARRMSTAHLPWTPENRTWTLDPLGDGEGIETTVYVDYNDHGTNPFVHSYHPDHDNFDARYASILPQGVESYGITRHIRLRFRPAGTDFESITETGTTLSGIYEETLILSGRGMDQRQFEARGTFHLSRVSDIAHLTE